MRPARQAPSPLLPMTMATWLLALFVGQQPRGASPQAAEPPRPIPTDRAHTPFLTSHECLACHNGLITAAGEDVSIGGSWRASMMANSSRDPYWQAAVRRETIDHPSAKVQIEDECSTCHMPMSRAGAKAGGRSGEIFGHLPIGARKSEDGRLAADGVSCTLCHQIGPAGLGTKESFTGGFVLSPPTAAGARQMFGPFDVDRGRTTIMRSATGMTPTEAPHIRQSEMCATCHTLYTRALGSQGEVIGGVPEQVPYLEWRHSALQAEEQSCQSCHMPAVQEPTRMSAVLGEEREGVGRHTFLGGNFFMLRMLNRYRSDLGVEALPQELDAAAHATINQLQQEAGGLAIERGEVAAGALQVEVSVRNTTGHKLPTGYPSRRAWLHLTVRDRDDNIIFSSGAVTPSGLIRGNDGDADPGRFEPHYTEIRTEDEVQIYESVMRDIRGNPTTGLLQATGYVKDNRLLPRGFDKTTAPGDVAVVGGAARDRDFGAGGDRVRYTIDVAGRERPFRIDVDLRFQPIAFRWAQNLKGYEADETRRFVSFFDAMSAGSSVVLARSVLSVP